MANYNYDEFATEDYDFQSIEGPIVGEKAPNFSLATAQGETKMLLDFAGELLVLELGSITCPLFQGRRNVMEPLREIAGVSSAVLYVREAHPGAEIQAHKTFDDKMNCAVRLTSEDGETRTVFVDDIEGRAHNAYGHMPNSVFIINKNGCVVYRAEWNNPRATRNAVKALLAGRKVSAKPYFLPPQPKTALRTLKNAGKGSASDFFKGLPFLFWTNVIKRNLWLFLNRPQSGSNHTVC